jgi:hypothetical protein
LLLDFHGKGGEAMFKHIRKDVRIAKSADFAESDMRRWRDPSETKGRDNRPGHYSITGAFIQLDDSPKANEDVLK